MIDLTHTMEKFALFADMDVREAEQWRPLAAASVQKLENGLRRGVRVSDFSALLAEAAAADAYYRYCLIESGRGDASVSAGTVTVHTDHASRINAARQARLEALAAVSSVLSDGGFVFIST